MEKSKVKAIGFTQNGGPEVLKIIEIPIPKPGPLELLVEVKAISVNPIDTKLRKGSRGAPPDEEHPRIVGFDAAGIIKEIGSEVKNFKVGDEVLYFGALGKAGAYASLALADSRVAVKKPNNLGWDAAAALPLTYLTAWQCLVERMHVSENPEKNKGKRILITAGAGGVGSIAIQIAKKMLGLEVIATASRKETIEFVNKCGADHVINHRNPFAEEFQKIGFKDVDYIFHCWELTNDYAKHLLDVAKPLSTIGTLTAKEPINLGPFFAKSINLALEMAGAKQVFNIDVESQGLALQKGVDFLAKGEFFSTVTSAKPFSLENIKEAHELIDKGEVIGKLVFDSVDKF